MSESNTNSNTPPSIPPKRWGWRRLFLWGVLAGGGCLFLFLVLLAGITLPNLWRKVPPPEISGPQRVSGNASDQPASKTSSSETFTSGTLTTLNLDDYPHLSPKMRELAQAWFEQYRKTIEALDTIPDPVLRAQAAATLENLWKMQLFLKLPLEWGNQTHWNAFAGIVTLDVQMRGGVSAYQQDINELVCPGMNKGKSPFQQLSSECPEFTEIFRKEASYFVALTSRMQFELAAYHQKWIRAEFDCWTNNTFALMAPEGGVLRDAYSWEDEVYCLRQLGGRGITALVARSYQRALDSHVANRLPESLFLKVRGVGNLVLIPTVLRPYGDEQLQEAKELFSGEDNLPKTEEETKTMIQSLEEEMDKTETSATLPIGS
ncbi:MAG TPA: hypothetical protein PLA90_05020 [Candidatus Sumerlaeota bacterium]|nr:hypothetical protein [Candidatus Sumerlaeota bacterium]HPS00884.1 hypothetical protein [Candidatus Sumerlaeota bacterium]